jgi:hypothetical protein
MKHLLVLSSGTLLSIKRSLELHLVDASPVMPQGRSSKAATSESSVKLKLASKEGLGSEANGSNHMARIERAQALGQGSRTQRSRQMVSLFKANRTWDRDRDHSHSPSEHQFPDKNLVGTSPQHLIHIH